MQRRSQRAIVELKCCAVGDNGSCERRVGAPCEGGNGFDASERHGVGYEIQVLCGRPFASQTTEEKLRNHGKDVNIKYSGD